MATTQLLEGSIRICKALAPNARTEWQLEVKAATGAQVTLGLDYPLREFLREVLRDYQDDEPAAPREWFEEDELLDEDGHPDGCQCADCLDGV